MTTHVGESAVVRRLVAQTRAIQWWIDKQIERGRTDEQIEAELPLATAFIIGRISIAELIDLRQRAMAWRDTR